MSLPVSALSDLELLHYAGIDESAQAELSRRCGTTQGIEIYDYIADLEAQVKDLQSEDDDSSFSCCSVDTDIEECINRVWALLKGHAGMDSETLQASVKSALGEMADFVTSGKD